MDPLVGIGPTAA